MLTARRALLWAVALAATAAVALAYRAAGLTLALRESVPYLLMLAIVATATMLRAGLTTERQRRLVEVITLCGLFCWVSMAGALASYAVAAGSIGYQDALLARADRLVGFDWPSAYRFSAERPWLTVAGGAAYRSIFLTPLAVVGLLAWTGRSQRAERFILAFAAALAIALLSFHFWPARSALAHFVGTDAHYLPATGIAHVALIEALRSGAVTEVDPGRIVGLITFPSFHAVCAVLFTWAGWPIRGLRVPLLAVNGAMLLATPVEGTHYLIDVIAGVALAGVMIAVDRLRVPGLRPDPAGIRAAA